MKYIDTKSILLAAAAVSVAAGTIAVPASAAGKSEKCYGVAKAGKNDCATGTSSCAGTSKVNNQKDAFVLVPAGLCTKLTRGALKPSR